MLTAADDNALLRAWSLGDRRAGNALVARHFAAVYAFFRNKVDAYVDDLTQRTFLGCVESIRSFRNEASFRSFLFGVARKQLLRFFDERRRGGMKLAMVEATAQQVEPSHSGFVAGRQEEMVLANAMRKLPVDLQITTELYYAEELSVGEVASVVGVPAGTVRSRLARARELLKRAVRSSGAPRHLQDSTIHDLQGWARRLRETLGRADPPTLH